MAQFISKEILKLRREYQQLCKSEIEIYKLKKEKLHELQNKCDHTLIAEAPYVKYNYLPTDPPRRICEVCGLEEDGWESGYKILKTDRVRNITRDQIHEIHLLKNDIKNEKDFLEKEEEEEKIKKLCEKQIKKRGYPVKKED